MLSAAEIPPKNEQVPHRAFGPVRNDKDSGDEGESAVAANPAITESKFPLLAKDARNGAPPFP
jgi:hypothetical protein